MSDIPQTVAAGLRRAYLNDVVANGTLQLWHIDHDNFGRLLNTLEDQIELLHTGGSPDYTLMLDIMYYMTHYPDALHHPKEDLVFARLRLRDRSLATTVDALTRQHAELHQLGDRLLRLLDASAEDSITPREVIAAAAKTYVAGFRAHMRTEECEMLPAAALLLEADDWAEIDTAMRNFEDPLFGSCTEGRYAGLREQIEREAAPSAAPGP
jgi:hemerythrin-like domain-containing protein